MTESDRVYRLGLRENDLFYFQVVYKETDLYIGIRKDRFLPEIAARVDSEVHILRNQLDAYMRLDPEFFRTLRPYDPKPSAPPAALEMAAAARKAGVGPMAAVAGVFADHVGRELTRFSRDVIIENGGDIFLKSSRRRRIGIFAGDSPFSGRLAVEIPAHLTPLGICTSSGAVGHSFSMGKADAVVILAATATLADAVATAAANLVTGPEYVDRAVGFAMSIEGVTGALAIMGELLAAKGQIKLVPTDKAPG